MGACCATRSCGGPGITPRRRPALSPRILAGCERPRARPRGTGAVLAQPPHPPSCCTQTAVRAPPRRVCARRRAMVCWGCCVCVRVRRVVGNTQVALRQWYWQEALTQTGQAALASFGSLCAVHPDAPNAGRLRAACLPPRGVHPCSIARAPYPCNAVSHVSSPVLGHPLSELSASIMCAVRVGGLAM